MSPVTVAPDPGLTEKFLRTMLDYAPEQMHFHLFCLNSDDDHHAYWCPVGQLEQIVVKVPMLCQKWRNVWFSTGLYERPLERGQRGRSDAVVGVPGLRIDLDILSPVHKKTTLPPTEEEALRVLRTFELPPTWIIRSGHGLQAFWQFKEPWTFLQAKGGPDPDEWKAAGELMYAFTGTLQELSRRAGYVGAVDSTGDLARVLRLPGTLNRKTDEPRLVEILEYSERFYNPSDFEPYLLNVEAQPSRTFSGVKKTEGDPAPVEMILNGCEWLKHCITDAATLPEPEWKALADLTARMERGLDFFLDASRPYPGFSESEAREKFALALHCSPGPPTCRRIRTQLDGEAHCRQCSQWGETKDPKIKSPIVLGRPQTRWITGMGGKGEQPEHSESPEQKTANSLAAELAEFEENDAGNGKRLVARHGEDLHFTPERGAWFVWSESRWIEDDFEALRRMKDTQQGIFAEALLLEEKAAQRRFGWAINSGNAVRLKNALWSAQSEPGKVIRETEWDGDPWLLGAIGATINLQTQEVTEPKRTDLLTKRCPVIFDASARCPHFLAFLRQIMDGNENLVSYLQRVFGFCLTGIPADRCMWFFYGSGRNGKSTLLNVLHDLLGTYAKKTPAETLLARQGGDGIPNDLAALVGARVVTSAELAESRRLNEARIKDLTGRDTITARFMRQEFFTFNPTFKLFMYGNHRPVVRGTDDGIWDRMKLVPFTVRIETPDESLPDKLRAELPGILNWALEGCRVWQADGLQHPEEVAAATEAYRAEQDPLADFLNEYCVRDGMFQVSGPDLWDGYHAWCSNNHERETLGRKEFSQKLTDQGFTQKATTKARLWKGLSLTEEAGVELRAWRSRNSTRRFGASANDDR